jgi:nucleotide-binding universal stress UspA family protein
MAGYVIVPLDGSKLAEEALPLAVSLAQQMDSRLLLVQVVSLVPIPHKPRYMKAMRKFAKTLCANAKSYLSQVKKQLEESDLPIETAIVKGYPSEAITKLANKEPGSVIVMSTHGRTGLKRWALGSVADKVLHLTRRPLILMHPPPKESTPHLLSHLPQIKRIIVPLDGSSLAEEVLPHVKKLARVYQAELLLFRSISTMPSELSTISPETNWDQVIHSDAQKYLERIVADLRAEGFSARAMIGDVPVADRILAHAASEKTDLIAMTTHARNALGRLILGSVTDRVVRAGDLPVLVTRAETQ